MPTERQMAAGSQFGAVGAQRRTAAIWTRSGKGLAADAYWIAIRTTGPPM